MKDKVEIKAFIDLNLRKWKEYLQPLHYILDKSDSVELEILVRYVQNRLRAALGYFVNGCYWFEFTKQDLFFPFYRNVENRIKQIFEELCPVFKMLSLRFNCFSECFLRLSDINKSTFMTENQIAQLFGVFYRDFERISAGLGYEHEVKKNICPEMKIVDYPVHILRCLHKLDNLKNFAKDCLKEYLAGFYLHGSFSTMDFIPYWSDIDTLMIIKKETVLNAKKLVQLRKLSIVSHKYFYQIDPHQLHGHFLISEFDLGYYPQTYFPLMLFDYSKSIFDNDMPLSFRLRDCHSERIAAFWHDAVSYFLYVDLRLRRPGVFSMVNRDRKLFIHRLLTFPLFYLQAKGIHVYKKDSFNQAKDDFDDGLWEIVKTATAIREGWRYRYQANRFFGFVFSLHPKLVLLKINKYYDLRYKFIDGIFRDFISEYEKMLPQAIDLSMAAWNRIVSTINQAGYSANVKMEK